MQRRTGHVLVVDDDALNRRLVTATLAREGLRTTSANDGAEALKAIGEDPPDVILLDIEMPGMDGFEVLEHIKSDEKLRHLPVIMISGLDDTESVVRCLEIGADDFLPKPFDAAILRARINAGLDRKALHDLEHERVRDIFMRFLPEAMVDEVLARTDGDARIRPELLTGTVLFGDLRGFTSYAEGRAVEEVIEAINTYLTLMTDAVLDHGGTIVDYMGDGIMAAFGAPVANDDHAELAIAAARAMAGEQLATFNAWLSATGVDAAAPDGDRDQLGAGALGERRLAAATRLRGDRRHDEHRLSDRGDDEAARPRRAVLAGDEETRCARRRRTRSRSARSRSGGGAGASSSGPSTSRSRRDRARRRDPRRSATASPSSRRPRPAASAPSRSRTPSTGSPRPRASAEDMQAFYAEMHRIVGELMYAGNFYIALYDEERQAHQLALPRRRAR